VGGDTKASLAPVARGGEILSIASLTGIVSYLPSEMVITAAAGTPLATVAETLAECAQGLACEPPMLGPASTIGGAVGAGLSGPARPWCGALRDHVLGVEMINGRGERLRFGGQVMKNVAGFDVSRLVTGACGTLGVITQVSLRVMPRPAQCASLSWTVPLAAARERMLALARRPWPITGMCYDGSVLRVRIAGNAAAVSACTRALAADAERTDDPFWTELRDYALPLLRPGGEPRWRLSLPPAAPDPAPHVPGLWDWGGAQRFLRAPRAAAAALVAHCREHGGHATCLDDPQLCGGADAALAGLLERLRLAFDPARVFVPGRGAAWT
jgi:glycolate oxidase FAD binding subunit